jgi:hypothetical protein
MEITAIASQATGRLFVVGPDMAELLATVTLCETCLNLDEDIAEAG